MKEYKYIEMALFVSILILVSIIGMLVYPEAKTNVTTTPTPSVTYTPTATPTPSPTPSVTYTPSPTPRPTATILPTDEILVENEKTVNLFDENAGYYGNEKMSVKYVANAPYLAKRVRFAKRTLLEQIIISKYCIKNTPTYFFRVMIVGGDEKAPDLNQSIYDSGEVLTVGKCNGTTPQTQKKEVSFYPNTLVDARKYYWIVSYSDYSFGRFIMLRDSNETVDEQYWPVINNPYEKNLEKKWFNVDGDMEISIRVKPS